MIDSDKIALHYKVIADTAHKIEKVSKELSVLYTDSIFNEKRANLRKKHLEEYIKELELYNCVTPKQVYKLLRFFMHSL